MCDSISPSKARRSSLALFLLEKLIMVELPAIRTELSVTLENYKVQPDSDY